MLYQIQHSNLRTGTNRRQWEEMSETSRDSSEPYARGIISKNPFSQKSDVVGAIVAVMDLVLPNRDLTLDHFGSRSIAAGAICELAVTNEPDLAQGSLVHSAGYLGFARIDQAGVIAVGDDCILDDRRIGPVIGFESGHEPNHFSVIVGSDALQSGQDLGLKPGSPVVFHLADPSSETEAQ